MTSPGTDLPPLDVHAYAETLARLQYHPPELAPRVLHRVGLTEAQWPEVREAWVERIEEDLPRGGALVIAFAATFAETRRKLLRDGETLPEIPAKALPVEAPAADPWAGLPPAMRAFTSMKGTALAPEGPVQPALPFAPATASGAEEKRPAQAATADPWAGLPPAMRAFSSMKGTELALDVPAEPALPFAPAATSSVVEKPAAQAAPADPWAGLPPAMRAFTSMKGTALAPEGPVEPALPFVGDPPGGLSLERAASLHVELAMGGAARSDVLQRYGVTEEVYQKLAGYWGGRCARETSLRERWDDACAAYRAWLLRSRGVSR